MNKYNKEELKTLICDEKLSYEEIGRRFGVSGNAIKKAAFRFGIPLEKRRRINDKETFGKGEYRYPRGNCAFCGKEIVLYPQRTNEFCSNHCQSEYEYNENISKWKSGELSGHDKRFKVSKFVRRFLLEKNEYSCEECGCNLVNKYTGLSILQIHHKDGNAANSSEDNLELLCPNCHAMTENFGSRNKNSIRGYRREEYKKNGV